MKRITVCVPCRNEEGNVIPMAEAVIEQLNTLPEYDYEVIFIDNCSTDKTRDCIRSVCSKNKRIKAIFNAKNFPKGSGYHVLMQATGDCVMTLPCDFQIPVDLIPVMVHEWEHGATVVALMKTSSKENKMMFGFRRLYYKLSKSLSDTDTLSGFTGSGLYDKSFLDMCKTVDDPLINIRTMVALYAAKLVKIGYIEQKRRSGKSKNNSKTLIDIAITRFIGSSDLAPHYAVMSGLVLGVVSFIIAIYYFVRKLLYWDQFSMGIAPLVIGVFFIGAIQLIFIGLVGEYIIQINTRMKRHPRVVESERINFDSDTEIATRKENEK